MASQSCANKASQADNEGEPMVSTAKLLDIRDLHGSYLVKIRNPWDTARILHTYHLVPRGGDVAPIPGATPVTIPLQKSVVYSSVHTGAVDELGAIGAVKGVADAAYFRLEPITEGLASGKITDIGSSSSPDVEKLVSLHPDAILTSPFKNAGYGPLEQLAVPIVEMADYMEYTPLGRAEWIKFIGLLYGKYQKADSIYRAVVKDYIAIKTTADSAFSRPKVLTETMVAGVWNVPGGASYKARMIADAGGDYPWSDDSSNGSLQLDFSGVFEKASDADIWITTSYAAPLSRATLARDYEPNKRFKAYADNNIYTCDTSVVPLFDEFPFHPERLLRDYVIMLHPELSGDRTLRYFHKAE